MKMRLPFFVIVIVGMIAIAFGLAKRANAASLVWDTPLGTVGLPFESTELVAGYDIRYNQGISGASLPIWQLPNNLAALQVGAVGAWATQAANAQPYIAFGHDFAKDIPVLAQYQNAHFNAFGRWASDRGDKIPIGYGVSVGYSFWGPTAPPTTVPVQP